MPANYKSHISELMISDDVRERDNKLKTVATKIIKELESENFSMDEITEILDLCKIQNKNKLPDILEQRLKELKSNGEEEIWKKHPHDGRYAVSSLGRFELLNKKYTFGTMDSRYGYMIPPKPWLEKGSMVHVVVAKMFPELVENSGDPERNIVGHRDDVKYHNNTSNLIWLTPQENSNWGKVGEKIASKTGIPIRCIETNDKFPTFAHAAEDILQNPKYKSLHNSSVDSLRTQISSHLRKVSGFENVGGFHFEIIES